MKTIQIIIIIIMALTRLNAKQEMRLAISDLKAKGVPAATAEIVTDMLRKELFDTGMFLIIR